MVHMFMLLIDIVYKYNARKVLSFIVTVNAGITQAGITYICKYPNQYNNVAIFPVICPLDMSKLFVAVNEVDSQNKSSQPDLVPEKFWFTQCGWLRVFITVAMVMINTSFWKLFCNGFKRYHYENITSIRELSE